MIRPRGCGVRTGRPEASTHTFTRRPAGVSAGATIRPTRCVPSGAVHIPGVAAWYPASQGSGAAASKTWGTRCQETCWARSARYPERRVDLDLAETRTFSSRVVYPCCRMARWPVRPPSPSDTANALL